MLQASIHAAEVQKCLVCGQKCGGHIFNTKEMMFGLPGRFNYRVCGKCGSARLINIPKNLAGYYPKSYGSMLLYPMPKNLVIMVLFKAYLSSKPKSFIRRRINKRFGEPNVFQIFDIMLQFSNRETFKGATILDAGSGVGQWLLWTKLLGFKKKSWY